MNNILSIKKEALLRSFFFSNYFYGFCAVALSVEATLQQRMPINSFLYFGFIFFATVGFYVYPYLRRSAGSTNPRTNWYTRHYKLMHLQQMFITAIIVVVPVISVLINHKVLSDITALEWLLIGIFPVTGAFYYGIALFTKKLNIRKIGWLKPFIIGFTWAGLVTVYPVLHYSILHRQPYKINEVGTLLFLKNFMFVSVLCIMFDIKDYASDYISRLKTFVVKSGLRRTIFYILLPLAITGLIGFIFYAVTHYFSVMRIMLNCIPFVLLIAVALSLHRRRSLLYYLSVVDGLMLVKAVCGIIAITYF